EKGSRVTVYAADAFFQRPRAAHHRADAHECVHAVWLVELQSLVAKLPPGTVIARRTRPPDVVELDHDSRDAAWNVVRLHHVRFRQRPDRTKADLHRLSPSCGGAAVSLRLDSCPARTSCPRTGGCLLCDWILQRIRCRD